MKALITGAGGFLGQHLVKFLKSKDLEIYNLGRSQVNYSNHIPLTDVSKKKIIQEALSEIEPDYLFHLAGTSDASDNDEYFSVNTLFCSNLLESIDTLGLDEKTKVVIVGTSAEYGLVKDKDIPISEELTPNPINLYGETKLQQTKFSLSWHKKGRSITVVRPFNIIGPGMPSYLALGNFLKQIQSQPKGGDIKVGNLNTSRDFIDVSDVVNLIWILVNNKNASGKIFNLCRGVPVNILEALEYLIQLSGKDFRLLQEDILIKNNEIKIHYGENKKLMDLVGNYRFLAWEDSVKSML